MLAYVSLFLGLSGVFLIADWVLWTAIRPQLLQLQYANLRAELLAAAENEGIADLPDIRAVAMAITALGKWAPIFSVTTWIRSNQVEAVWRTQSRVPLHPVAAAAVRAADTLTRRYIFHDTAGGIIYRFFHGEFPVERTQITEMILSNPSLADCLMSMPAL